jgi:hypothetical protein
MKHRLLIVRYVPLGSLVDCGMLADDETEQIARQLGVFKMVLCCGRRKRVRADMPRRGLGLIQIRSLTEHMNFDSRPIATTTLENTNVTNHHSVKR